MHHSGEESGFSERMRKLTEGIPVQTLEDKEKEIQRLMDEQAKQIGLGATGAFPEGKLDNSDEGEIKIGVTVANGKVVVNFGTPVVWFGMDSKQARQLAESIRQASYRAEKVTTA